MLEPRAVTPPPRSARGPWANMHAMPVTPTGGSIRRSSVYACIAVAPDTFVVRVRVEAPCHHVFDALTRRSAVAIWLSDRTRIRVTELRLDMREGGAYRYRHADCLTGEAIDVFGSLTRVETNRCIEAIELRETAAGTSERRIEATLHPDGRATELRLTVTYPSASDFTAARNGAVELATVAALERLANTAATEAIQRRRGGRARAVFDCVRSADGAQTRIVPLEAS